MGRFTRFLFAIGITCQVHPAHENGQRKSTSENEITVHRSPVQVPDRSHFLQADDNESPAGLRAKTLASGQISREPLPRSASSSAQNDTAVPTVAIERFDRAATATNRSLFRSDSLKFGRRLIASSSPRPLNHFIQNFGGFTTREISRPAASDYHDVRSIGQALTRMAKPLSNTAFYAIANHRASHSLADGDPQSPLLLVGLPDGTFDPRRNHDDKTFGTSTFPRFNCAPKILSAQDSVYSPKAAHFEKHEVYFEEILAARRFRPFARRRLRIARPARVLDRARNP